MWGSIAEWLSALAAIGALIAAIAAALISKQLYVTETDRDSASRAREERDQASAIASWAVALRTDLNARDKQRGLLILNSSNSPVYDVEVESTYALKKDSAPENMRKLKVSLVPPGEYVASEHEQFGWTFPQERAAITQVCSPVMNNPNWCVTRFSFTDGHGVRWVRSAAALEKVTGR